QPKPEICRGHIVMISSPITHAYEVRPREDHRGVDLISDVLPFGRLWYSKPSPIAMLVGKAKFCSCSRHAVIRLRRQKSHASRVLTFVASVCHCASWACCVSGAWRL